MGMPKVIQQMAALLHVSSEGPEKVSRLLDLQLKLRTTNPEAPGSALDKEKDKNVELQELGVRRDGGSFCFSFTS